MFGSRDGTIEPVRCFPGVESSVLRASHEAGAEEGLGLCEVWGHADVRLDHLSLDSDVDLCAEAGVEF